MFKYRIVRWVLGTSPLFVAIYMPYRWVRDRMPFITGRGHENAPPPED